MTTTNHPLTKDRIQELLHATGFIADLDDDLYASTRDHLFSLLRAVFDAGREHEREHADPRHDPRPWQDCTRDDIRKGDLVEARSGDRLLVGVAHHQDEDGDWCTEDGWMLTSGDHWPLRRIPAPTPPAEEITLPTGHPAHITDVEDADGDVCAYMAMNRFGGWFGVDQDGDIRNWVPGAITAFALPDGTRARRDGDHADGTPRFVEEDA